MKVISFMSGKGGVGKSTLTAAISQKLAAKRYKTLVVELDIPLRSLDHLFGVVDRVVYDLSDIIDGRPMEEVTINIKDSLDYIPSPLTVQTTFTKENLSKIIEEAIKNYDYCLIDCKAGLDNFIVDIASLSDLAAIIITPDEISLRDGALLSDYLHYNDILAAGEHRIIVNKADLKRKNNLDNFDFIIDTVGAQLLGVVPLFTKSNEQQQIFNNLADRLIGKRVPLSVK